VFGEVGGKPSYMPHLQSRRWYYKLPTMILVFVLLIVIVFYLVQQHVEVQPTIPIKCEFDETRLETIKFTNENRGSSGDGDFNDNSQIIEPIDNATTSFLYAMKDPEPEVYNLIVQKLSPYSKSAEDLLADWIGPDDGTDDGSDDLWTSFANWHSDEKVYNTMCGQLAKACMQFSNATFENTYLNINYENMIKTTFAKIFRAIDEWEYKDNTFPWGNNWYEFVVSGPYSMILGIFHLYTIGKLRSEMIETIKAGYIAYVEKLYTSPVVAIGWQRTGSNTLLQGAPFILGHFWKGDLDECRKEEDYQYMIEQCNIVMVVAGEGLRPDYGWIFHSIVRAFGYLGSTINYANIINYFEKNNYGDIYNIVSTIMCHPTIEANLPGLFSRQSKVKRFMGAGSFGINLQYSDAIVNVKNKTFFMQFMGQQRDIAYIESDKTNERSLPLWLTCREMWVVGDTIRQYDEEKNIQYVPGHHVVNNEIVSLPSLAITTHYMRPNGGWSAALLIDDTTVAFVNFYNIVKSDSTDNIECAGGCYPYTLFNALGIHELMLIDENSRTSAYSFIANKVDDYSDYDNFEHVAEVGIVEEKLADNIYKFTNGKVLEIVTGTLRTIDVEYTHTVTGSTIPITKTETVFLLSPVAPAEGTYGWDDLEHPGDPELNRILVYRVYATMPEKFSSQPQLFMCIDANAIYHGKQYSTNTLIVGKHVLTCPTWLQLQNSFSSHCLYVNTDTMDGIMSHTTINMTARSVLYPYYLNGLLPTNMMVIPRCITLDGKPKPAKLYNQNAGDDVPEFIGAAYTGKALVYYTGDYEFPFRVKVRKIDEDEEIEYISTNFSKKSPYMRNGWGFYHDKVPVALFGIDSDEFVSLDDMDDKFVELREKYNPGTEIDPNDWEPFAENGQVKSLHQIAKYQERKLKSVGAGLPLKNCKVLKFTIQNPTFVYMPADENSYYAGQPTQDYVIFGVKAADQNGYIPTDKQTVIIDKHILKQLESQQKPKISQKRKRVGNTPKVKRTKEQESII
jgi:hypothetical protein